MSSLRLLACALVTALALVACLEYKAEPEDGKQGCAFGPAGTKRCPDNYHCNDQDQRCYKNAPGAGGSVGPSSAMTCSDSGIACATPVSKCCNSFECKYVVGSAEYKCDGYNCASAAQSAADHCPGGAGGAGGAGGTSGARSSGSAMICSLASDIPCNTSISKCCNSFECKYVAGSLEYPCNGFNCASAAESARANCGGGSGGAKGGTGGSKASGGSSGTVASSGDTVTFRYGQATGLPMTGFGWIALGSMDILTDPTCGTSNARITPSQPCVDATNWNSASALCISGTIPALPESPVQADYEENWGIQIGVNVAETPTGTLNRSYSTVSVNVSNAPTWGVRLVVHRKGDPDGTTYCHDGAVSGKVVSLRNFNTKCWGDPTTVSLTESDIPNIDRLGVQVSSMMSTITLSNMCLNSITFGK